MSTPTALPPVAQRVYTDCKKCACERFHIVLSHTTPASAKLECEVCHAKKTLKVGAAAKKKAKPGAKKARVGASNRWEDVKILINENQKQSYNMKMTASLNLTIDHPKFGIGVVTSIVGQSMEVVFADGIRSLVHNRP